MSSINKLLLSLSPPFLLFVLFAPLSKPPWLFLILHLFCTIYLFLKYLPLPTELRVFLPLSALFTPAVGALRWEHSSSHFHCRSCCMCKASWALLLPPRPVLHCLGASGASVVEVEAYRTWEVFEKFRHLLPNDIVDIKCKNASLGCILLA